MGCGKFDLHKPELDWGLDGKRKIAEWGFSDGIDNEGKHDGLRAYVRAGRQPKGPFLKYLQGLGLADAHVEDYEKRKGHGATFVTPLSDQAYGDNWIARNGLELLQGAPKDKPWFLQVNFNGPHEPWDITASMEKRWRGVKFPQPNRSTELTPEVHERVRQNYAAMIENIDRRVGELVAAVKRGLRVEGPATTLDLVATFLDYAGVSQPAGMASRSLRSVVRGKSGGRRGRCCFIWRRTRRRM